MRTPRTLLLVAGLIIAAAAPAAAAAPPGTGTGTASFFGAMWLQTQVNDQGYIPSAFDPSQADASATAQAITALAAAGVGRAKVDAMLAYLGTHVDDLAVSSGADSPGGLAYLILAVEAAGGDATSFGSPSTNLVDRLLATLQTTGTDIGLFGSQDPTFDGAFRQGLAVLALEAAGVTIPESATTWLLDQQCANDLWTAYRADTSVACPAVDPTTFSGPDTNSTALAVMGLQLAGQATAAAAGVAALDGVRVKDGGWGYLADALQASDANSTAVVASAFRLVNGTADTAALDRLAALQILCTGDAADHGAFAYQPDVDGTLFPNVLASVQAVPAMAGVALPVVDATIGEAQPIICIPSETAPTTTTIATDTTPTTAQAVADSGLARTGTEMAALAIVSLALIGLGGVLLAEGRRRARLR